MMQHTIKKFMLLVVILMLSCKAYIGMAFATETSSKQTVVKKSVPLKKRINLDFQAIPVRSVLQLFAEFINKNLIISDSVTGNITLHLKNIPWDNALAIILQSQGLAKHETDQVMTIAPVQEITQLEAREVEQQKNNANLAPLYSQIFHIHYGNAQTYLTMLQGSQQNNTVDLGSNPGMTGLLSQRGRVILDQRTNTLFVDDTAQHLRLIRKFLQETDIPQKQVMIEARIVSVKKSFEQNLGINFGLKQSGGAGNGAFNMDFGGDRTGPGYSNLSLQFSRLPANFLLDLELSALESENDADVISSPRVITASNMQATIEQGQQVPFNTQAASGGTTTQFVEAMLKLDVTPQITPDNKIILKLIVTNDVPKIDATGVALIDTKKVNTTILMGDGETVVLGGIYERNKSNEENRVPFLSAIPLLGNLFKSTQIKDARNELLVFVTPRIVKSESS